MILTDNEIINAVKSKEIVIDPFNEENVGPTSYDVTLSTNFTVYPTQVFDVADENKGLPFEVKENESIIITPPHFDVFEWYDVETGRTLIVFRQRSHRMMHQLDMYVDVDEINLAIPWGEYAVYTNVLGSTNEYIKLPDNISAEYTGRSSLGRLFLQSHQTAGWIDAGFEGTITLELTALEYPIILYPNIKIGQLIFHRHNKCNIPYNKRLSSKYNKQIGAVASRIHLDFY